MMQMVENVMTEEYVLRPAHSDEAGLFYAQTAELDAEMGCIGHYPR